MYGIGLRRRSVIDCGAHLRAKRFFSSGGCRNHAEPPNQFASEFWVASDPYLQIFRASPDTRACLIGVEDLVNYIFLLIISLLFFFLSFKIITIIRGMAASHSRPKRRSAGGLGAGKNQFMFCTITDLASSHVGICFLSWKNVTGLYLKMVRYFPTISTYQQLKKKSLGTVTVSLSLPMNCFELSRAQYFMHNYMSCLGYISNASCSQFVRKKLINLSQQVSAIHNLVKQNKK